MDKRLYVREENLEVEFEIEGKRLDITMHINPLESSYAFPEIGVSRLLVEEKKNGKAREFFLSYFHYMRLLVPPGPSDSEKPSLYFPENLFAQQLDDLFMKLVHGDSYAGLFPEERRPIANYDLSELARQTRTILTVDQERRKAESLYLKGELSQALEGHLLGKPLPVGMNLIKIPSWLDEPEDPFAYSLHIDLGK